MHCNILISYIVSVAFIYKEFTSSNFLVVSVGSNWPCAISCTYAHPGVPCSGSGGRKVFTLPVRSEPMALPVSLATVILPQNGKWYRSSLLM